MPIALTLFSLVFFGVGLLAATRIASDIQLQIAVTAFAAGVILLGLAAAISSVDALRKELRQARERD